MLRSMPLNDDYFTPLSRAVASIDRDSYAARYAIYDREHKALLRRLATADSPCSDADVVREEQAFREAIRRIEFVDLDDQPPLIPQDELAEETSPGPRRDAAWRDIRPAEVRPAEMRPVEVRPVAREAFEEWDLPSVGPPEPVAIEPLPLLQLSEPRSITRRVGERLALAVVALVLAGAWAWLGEGGRDVTSPPILRGAVEPVEPAPAGDMTEAKGPQPTWLSPEMFYAPPALPSSPPKPGPALASAPRPDVPLPVPRPER
jgi:hypothetical protein